MTWFEPVPEARRQDTLVAWLLFVGSVVVLWATERAVGYVRDESFYFHASQNHAQWFDLLFSRPAAALQPANIDRWLDYNHEHPALMKDLYGLSWLLFHQKLGWLSPAVAFRLPAFALAAVIPAVLYKMGTGIYGRAAGVFAAVSFLLIPRQFFNAHLAAFDVPVATFWLLIVYAFWRAQERSLWWLWCGVFFGLGLATKHNTFFVPLVMAPFVLYLAWRQSTGKPQARTLALAFVGLYVGVAVLYGFLALILGDAFIARFTLLSPHTALYLVALIGGGVLLVRLRALDVGTFRPLACAHAMLLFGPLLVYVTWPYLWHDPVPRVAWWLAFHAKHNHYAWYYLGTLMRAPPFPLAYVLVKTALTVPTSLFVPMVLGFVTVCLRLLSTVVPSLAAWTRRASWIDALVVVNAVASIAVISHPDVPHFGGVKHWFPSMLFLGLLGGVAISECAAWIVRALASRRKSVPGWLAYVPLLVLVSAPALWASVRIHPYGTSYYSELAGGVPGAASLGMQRQFWSNNVTGVLPWINENAPNGARVWLHEVTDLSFRYYQQNGLLRADLRAVGSPQSADIAAYQYHQEFREQEFNAWEALGTTRPAFGLFVDETPQVVVYRRR